MLQLKFRQRLISLMGQYDILDQDDHVAFKVKGNLTLVRKAMTVYDGNDRKLGMIRRQLLCLMPTFDIIRDDQVVGTIRKKLSLFSPVFEMEYKGWQIEGDIWAWDYSIKSGSKTIATLQKKLLAMTDTYIINIEDPADAEDVVLLVAAIDMEKAEK